MVLCREGHEDAAAGRERAAGTCEGTDDPPPDWWQSPTKVKKNPCFDVLALRKLC